MAGGHMDVRVDTCQCGPQRVNFRLADLVDKILLPVQVGRFDHVKIGQDQLANPDARQSDRHR